VSKPFERSATDAAGTVRDFLQVEGLIVAPNGVEVFRTTKDGSFGTGVQLQAGGSVSTARPSGVLTTNTTSAGTIADTNETDLWTYSLPASTLDTNGRGVRITVFGTAAANANLKTVKVYFGATAVSSLGTAMNGGGWAVTATVIRVGATTQISGSLGLGVNGTSISSQSTAPAETLANAITIKMTGQNGTASANDIVFKGATVELL